MPDYTKTVIYKIENYDDLNLCYVGHTTNFTKRKQAHKRTCNNASYKGHQCKLYRMIRENGGWESFQMIFVCDYPCSSKRDAEKEEDRYMLEFKSKMNDKRAFHTNQEYRLENVQVKKEYDKKYREENKERLNLKSKEYRYENKETLNLQAKKFREENWEHVNRKQDCECGMKNMCVSHMNRHRKSEVHNRCLNYTEEDNKYYRCECGIVLTKLKKKRHETESNHHIKYIISSNS
jgi:hypothetical protein